MPSKALASTPRWRRSSALFTELVSVPRVCARRVVMKAARFVTQLKYSIIAVLMLASAGPSRAQTQHHEPASDAKSRANANALVKVVRESTERFKDVAMAEAEGYHLLFGCVSGPDAGAMGMHFVNLALLADGELDATRPEIVIYEPQ